ncbi:hypothetical protein BC831DRAFT_476010, partial [Entophlyctis helioformis]
PASRRVLGPSLPVLCLSLHVSACCHPLLTHTHRIVILGTLRTSIALGAFAVCDCLITTPSHFPLHPTFPPRSPACLPACFHDHLLVYELVAYLICLCTSLQSLVHAPTAYPACLPSPTPHSHSPHCHPVAASISKMGIPRGNFANINRLGSFCRL